jgi:hypothetical protein
MTERDVTLASSLDEALDEFTRVSRELSAEVVITDGASDFRSGHLEVDGTALLDVVLMSQERGCTVVRIDTRDPFGARVADALASVPAAE